MARSFTDPNVARVRLHRLRRLRELRRERDRRALEASANTQYAHDPVGWATDVAGTFVWSKPRAILEAVRDEPRVAVPACHSSSKTHTAALAAGWFIDTHAPGTAMVVSSAPTNTQIRALLWQEINRLHRRAGLPGRLNQTEWWLADELVAFGRKSRDQDPDAFQGVHAEHLLVIIDEAAGFSEQLWEAADTLASGGDAHILAIGNPDQSGSEFAKRCRSDDWFTIQIPASSTPNFTGEPVPDLLRRVLIQPAWVERKRRQWGEDHPYWYSKVLAQFPAVDEALVIPPALVARAQALWEDVAYQPMAALDRPWVLSVDPARFGTDLTVWAARHGPRFRVLETRATTRTSQVTDAAKRHAMEQQTTEIRVDAVGVGGGVADELQALSDQGLLGAIQVVPMDAGAAALTQPHVYLNARAEWWFGLRDALREGRVALDPADDELDEQLTAVRYAIVGGQGPQAGKIKVESKEDMRARGVASPDRADCAVLAYAHVPEPADVVTVPTDGGLGLGDADLGMAPADRPIQEVEF